ncbi:MAG: preprotein translocase subunit YajC [Christensenellaceae bacterium]|nr:preprotein translocase subunit YajC [Christensenellaceae bacterium]
MFNMDIMLLVVMMVVFYLLFIRPENKRKKQAENLRNNLKKGDRIVTIGGMIGKIVQVNDSTVVFETSEDRVRIELSKWGVQSVLTAPAPGKKKNAKVEETVEDVTTEELQHNAASEVAEQIEAENK